jgi:hypothetical protein
MAICSYRCIERMTYLTKYGHVCKPTQSDGMNCFWIADSTWTTQMILVGIGKPKVAFKIKLRQARTRVKSSDMCQRRPDDVITSKNAGPAGLAVQDPAEGNESERQQPAEAVAAQSNCLTQWPREESGLGATASSGRYELPRLPQAKR